MLNDLSMCRNVQIILFGEKKTINKLIKKTKAKEAVLTTLRQDSCVFTVQMAK